MAFQQGLSGLSIASKALDAISNNVSNSGTVGFKQATAQFADVFAASLAAGSSTQVGIGASIGNVAQQFTQGNISTTSNTLDLAINGAGFYRMSDSGSITYSRNGQFHVDKDGYVVNASGLRLTGNTFDAKGLPSGVGGEIKMSFGDADPKATTSAGYNVNLDSRSASPSALTKATLYGTAVPGTVATPLVLTATNNTLSIAVDGEAAASINIAAGSYPDSSSLVAAVQAGIDKSSLKGRVEVSADSSGKLTLTSKHRSRGPPAAERRDRQRQQRGRRDLVGHRSGAPDHCPDAGGRHHQHHVGFRRWRQPGHRHAQRRHLPGHRQPRRRSPGRRECHRPHGPAGQGRGGQQRQR